MPLLRAVALNVIKSLVPLNLPGAQIIHHLQQMHIAYRRTDMLADIRTAFDRVKYETQVTALSPVSKVPEAWMNTEKLGEPYNYRVHLKLDVYDPVTDSYTSVHRYMFMDDNLSVDEYAGAFPDYAEKTGSPSLEGVSDLRVVGVTKNMRPGPAPF